MSGRWIPRLLVVALGLFSSPAAPASDGLDYPPARRGDVVDELHGVKVADPYRWMEEMESAETMGWVKAQDELFREYVGGTPLREALEKRIAEIARYESYSAPIRGGDRYFFSHTEAGARHSVVRVRESRASESRPLIDPERFFSDEKYTLNGWKPSPDGRLVVYGESIGQTIWRKTKILDVDSGKVLDDVLVGLGDMSNVQWTMDSRGLFYRRFDLPEDETSASYKLRNPRICYHKLGTPQSDDEVLLSFASKPDLLPTVVRLTPDDRFLVVETRDKKSPMRSVLCRDLRDEGGGFQQVAEFDSRATFLTNVDARLLYCTDQGAPRGRIVSIDPAEPGESNWKTLVPESDERLASAQVCSDRIIARYSRHARTVAKIFALDGRFERELESPILGGLSFSGKPGEPDVFMRTGNLFTPGVIYRVDLATGPAQRFFEPKLNFDPKRYEMKQVFYAGKDGTRIPMFIAYKKGLKLDGSPPLWMYAYGHGGWVAFPWFQAHLVAWLDLGGVYALPNIRGGGEYGAKWKEAGVRRNKPTAFADYFAAAEWLIENKYTSADRLVANGGSASGILPAWAVVQRPELFGAAVIDVPFLDMVRYHLSASGFTGGYGSPEDPGDFEVLRSYSPYHNVASGKCYPPTLVSVAEKDQSTAPHHGYKFTAAMQEAQACHSPVMMQVIWGAGHYTFGVTPQQRHESLANQIAFLVRALKIEVPREALRSVAR